MENKLKALLQQGYSRIKINNTVIRIDEAEAFSETIKDIFLVVDRIIVRNEEDFHNRLTDAIQTAFFEGKNECIIESIDDKKFKTFSNKFELDSITFLEPNIHLFSFNNPYGACPKCEGYGDVIGIDEDLVIPNTGLSVYENAIFPWRGESMSWYRDQLVNNSHHFNFPIHKPFFELSDKDKQLVWSGNQYFEGLTSFFSELESKAYKIQNRVMLSRYRGKTKCSTCNGKRLRVEANYVKVGHATITDLVEMPLNKLAPFLSNWSLTITILKSQIGC